MTTTPGGPKMSELVEAYNVHSLEFSHDNKLIANGTWNAFKVWDVRSGKLMQSFALSKPTGNSWQVNDVHFTQDNKGIICAAWDKSERGQVFVGDLKTGKILQKITFDAPWFVTVACYPGEKELAVAYGDKISWWDIKGPTFSKTVQVKDETSDTALGILQLAVHPNGKLLVSGLYRVYIIGTDRNPRATNIRHQFVGIREGGKTLVTYDTGLYELHIVLAQSSSGIVEPGFV